MQIACVIMDWAGTSIDFGCFAPVNAFKKAFEVAGIEVTTGEVRKPMGRAKIEHIRQLLRMDRIKNEFRYVHQRDWNEEDVARLNRSFETFLFDILADYANPIPHVIDTVETLRQKGLKIGSTTGYTRAMMDVVEPSALTKGYFPDNCVTPDGLPAGRPAPFMIFKNMIDLNIQRLDCVLKIGDTLEDIREGLYAKCWSVGVITGSSELGLSEEELEKLPKNLLAEKKAFVRQRMINAGAHFVLDTIEELPDCIEQINFINKQEEYL